jgi:hypothetical protein
LIATAWSVRLSTSPTSAPSRRRAKGPKRNGPSSGGRLRPSSVALNVRRSAPDYSKGRARLLFHRSVASLKWRVAYFRQYQPVPGFPQLSLIVRPYAVCAVNLGPPCADRGIALPGSITAPPALLSLVALCVSQWSGASLIVAEFRAGKWTLRGAYLQNGPELPTAPA